jgi:hypothetical protein
LWRVKVSPFPYHGPLRPEQVQGRDDLVADLVERVSEHRVSALLGPRRYGKTSLLRRVDAEVSASGTSVIWGDLYEVTSMVDVAVRLDEALGSTVGPVREKVRAVAASIDLNLGLVRLSFTRPGRPDAAATLHALLDILVRGALEHPTVLVLDEFSGIARCRERRDCCGRSCSTTTRTSGCSSPGRSQPRCRRCSAIGPSRSTPKPTWCASGPLGRRPSARSWARGSAGRAGIPAPSPPTSSTSPEGTPTAPWRPPTRRGAGPLRAPPGHQRYGRRPSPRSAWSKASRPSGSSRGTPKPTSRCFAWWPPGRRSTADRQSCSGCRRSATAARQRLVAHGDLIDDAGRLRVVDPVLGDWIRRRVPAT